MSYESGSLNGISLQEIKSKSEETGPFIITFMQHEIELNEYDGNFNSTLGNLHHVL